MFDSIYKDLRHQFTTGNMVIRLIIINVGVFIIINLLKAFSPASSGTFDTILSFLAIPGEIMAFIKHFWTLFTHMFLHVGLWHMAINMLYLYWFGRIVGDLVGDRHILPLYILGGIVGGLAYVMSYQLLGSSIIGAYALGASAAVMALVMAAGLIAPEYNMRLLLIGNVKLKWVVLAIIVLDLISLANGRNTGGHIAHLAGVLFGYIYITSLRSGTDLSTWFSRKESANAQLSRKRSPLTVAHKSTNKHQGGHRAATKRTDDVDHILEKIKKSGYDSLTDEEKEVLYKASKS